MTRKKSTLKRVIKFIAAVLLIGVIFAGTYALYARHRLNSFLKTATENSEEVQTYSVATLKTSSFEKIDDLKDQKIGFLSTNPYLEQAEKELKEAVDYKIGLENDVDAMLKNLESGDNFLAIALENSYLDALDDEDILTKDDLKIIYTFEITLEEGTSSSSNLDEPFIAYISGSDSRGDLSQTARSDVNILAVVNPKTAKILLINTPRDYYVQLHGTSGMKDKLTHAGIYGVKMSKSTLEDLYGVEIDYTVKVGFKAVTGIVDALDGVDIDSDQEMTLKTEDGKTCHYVVGTQHVDGACALRFARERKSYASGDRHRGENQEQVIEKIVDKVSSDKTYLLKWAEILGAVEGSLDISMSFEDLSGFVHGQIKNPRNWQVESISVDGVGSYQPTYSMGSRPLYVMIPDETTLAAAKAKIAEYLD